MLLQRLFPEQIDNVHRGQWAGFWLLTPILLLNLAIAAGSVFTPANAIRADALDLTGFSPAAIREVVASTALLGWMALCMVLLGAVVMARYRAMVPMLYLWLIVEYLGRRLVLHAHPIDRVAGSGGASIFTLAILATLAAGLGLSLWPRRGAP